MQQSSCTSDFECFQNFTSSEVFVHQLASSVNGSDISMIIKNQKQMLQRFEKTNEMLLNVNQLSQNRLKNITEEYKKNSKLIVDMKKDLEYIFKKIRAIKSKMESKYPVAFEQAKRQNMQNFTEEPEETEEENILVYEQLESITNVDNIDDAEDATET